MRYSRRRVLKGVWLGGLSWLGMSKAARSVTAMGSSKLGEGASISPVPRVGERGPLVWFCPHPYPLREAPYRKTDQYMDLFAEGSPWKTAAARTNIFKIYMTPILHASDSDLRRLFAGLNHRGIALGLEFGPLTPSDACGRDVEGFVGPLALKAARRIKDNGGVLRYVAMDEPFFYGSLYNGPNACRWTAQQVAANAAANLKIFRKEFPGVIIGDIEPVPAPWPDWLKWYTEWIDAFRAAAGYSLAFFHDDVQWHDPTWQVAAASLEHAVHKRGIAFGMIYNGDPTDHSDIEWCRHAEERLTAFEFEHGGPPDQVIFQSWNAHPFHVLPEVERGAHTNLVVRYFRNRTRLSAAKDGGWVSGRLADSGGRPLAGAPVTPSNTAVRGNGLTGDYILQGTAPSWATAAEVGFEMYTSGLGHCACSGPGKFTLYNFQFTSNGPRTQLLKAERNFANGLNGWMVSIPEAVQVKAQTLHVAPRRVKPLTMRSSSFPVVAGAPFTLRIQARMPPESAHSGFFVLTFLPQQRGSRYAFAFRPLRVNLDSTVTKQDGTFRFRVPYDEPSDLELRVSFAGDEVHWPTEAVVGGKQAGREVE